MKSCFQFPTRLILHCDPGARVSYQKRFAWRHVQLFSGLRIWLRRYYVVAGHSVLRLSDVTLKPKAIGRDIVF